jgi:hypothetical protein
MEELEEGAGEKGQEKTEI